MSISLMPTKEVQALSPYHSYQKKHVPIDIREKSGDWHNIDGTIVLSKVALFRLASAAGMIWRETKEVYRSADAICYQATAAIRNEDGTFRMVTGTKEIDLKVIEDEILLKNLKKEKEGKLKGESPEIATKREMIQWRKNKVARAETGAMMRCIKAAIALGSYPLNELKEGFDVPVVSFAPDFSNPMVQQMLLQQAYGGGGMQPQIQAPHNYPALQAPQDEDDTIIDGSFHEVRNGHEQAPANAPSAPVAPPPQTSQTTQAAASSATTSGIICVECHREIKQNVADYAMKAYNMPLCYSCQDKAKAAKGAAA